MNIFDIVNDVCYYKRGNLHLESGFSTAAANSFILQRWVSMLPNSETIVNLNQTINLVQLDTADTYKLMIHTVPATKMSRLSYLKKKKVTNKEHDKVKESAIRLETSIRELTDSQRVLQYINGNVESE